MAAEAPNDDVEAKGGDAPAPAADAVPSASPTASQKEAPDPVIGIGLVILGVLVMGIGGAATLHYVFNAGTAITIIGALVFLIAVAMHSLKERKLRPQ